MKGFRTPFLSLVAISGLALICFIPNGLMAQSKASFKVSGPCMTCGEDRMLDIVKGMDGVKTAQFEAGQSLLNVEYDQALASVIDIQLELSLSGYDAGDFSHDAKATLPACAKLGAPIGMRGESASAMVLSDDLPEPGIDDLEDADDDTDWENPKSFDIVGNSSDNFEDFDLLEEDMEDMDELLEWGADSNEGDEFGISEDEDDE